MGAHFRQQFIRTSYRCLQSWLQHNHVHVIGASPDGPTNFHYVTYPRPTMLFLGEERGGLTEQQRSMCELLVHIPMTGQTDSLNLGVAGSLLLCEIFRARNE